MTTDHDPEQAPPRPEALPPETSPPGHGQPVPGRTMLAFFGVSVVVGVVAALALFAIAKRTAANQKAKAVQVPSTRLEHAGAAIATEVFRCAEQKPMKIAARMRMTPEGALAVIDVTSEPEDPIAVPCVRKIPIDLRVERGDGLGDVEIRYEGGVGPDGRRFSRVSWAAGE